QADLLRDQADRVAASLRDVEEKLAQAKKQRRLDSHLGALANENALFDESGTGRIVKSPGGDGAFGGAKSLDSRAGTPAAGGTMSAPGPGSTQPPQTTPSLAPVPSGNHDLGVPTSLAAAPGDSERTLAKKKSELKKALEDLTARAAAFDAEAKKASEA